MGISGVAWGTRLELLVVARERPEALRELERLGHRVNRGKRQQRRRPQRPARTRSQSCLVALRCVACAPETLVLVCGTPTGNDEHSDESLRHEEE